MTIDDLPPTISVAQAGEILGVSRRTAYRAVEAGQLPAVKIGGRWFIPSAKLLRLLGIDPEPVAEAQAGGRTSTPATSARS